MLNSKYPFCIAISFLCLACHDYGTSPIRVDSSVDKLNGTVRNWSFGDSVQIQLWVQVVDSALTYPSVLLSYGRVRTDGSFELPLPAPPEESLVRGTQNPSDTTTSNIYARFCYAQQFVLRGNSGAYLGRAQCYTDSYFLNPKLGDYYSDLVYADRPVRVHGHIFASNTVLADFNFSQGWNRRFFRFDSIASSRRFEVATIKNAFIGSWVRVP
jgi:hypothetical protein